MSGPEVPTRARVKHHKVATGCANCKRRRTKCDETKNGCERCRKANLLCPGYTPPKARIFELSSQSVASASEPATLSPLTLNRGIDIRIMWQTALLDTFLTTWLPHSLVRDYTSGREKDVVAPMSAWPRVAWKLAKRKDESFVAHALLCLTLCVIGSRTDDRRLVAEAARHYGRVLHHFQAQVSLLARTGYSARQDNQLASLAAAGFCCSQIEYVLGSWVNGDRHLQGMATLLQACGPACLRYEDTRSMYYDHYLLWTSCAIIHRRPSVYSTSPWIDSDWSGLPSPCNSLLAKAARVPPLLEEYDSFRRSNTHPDVQGLLQRLIDLVADMENLSRTQNFVTRSHSTNDYAHSSSTPAPCQVSDDSFLAMVMTGYSSAFVQHAGIAAWELIRSQATTNPYPTLINSSNELTNDRLREGCERHLAHICQTIDELANHRFGMITASPLLFLLDSAWMGYRILQQFCETDLDEVKPWFAKIGEYVRSIGYRPLSEPWLATEPMGCQYLQDVNH